MWFDLFFSLKERSEAWYTVCKHAVPDVDEKFVIFLHLGPEGKELVDALVEDALPEAHS